MKHRRAQLTVLLIKGRQLPTMARKLWRDHLRETWRDSRTLLFIVAAFAVVLLGAIGFHDWSHAPVKPPEQTRPEYSWLDSIYRALQLFGFGGNIENLPTTLQIARFMGPVLVGWAAFAGLMALSREQLQHLAFRRRRNHVVVAGLGLAGSRIATSFRAAGERVVVIERDPANPGIAGARAAGIGVLKGDATNSDVLRRAGVPYAKRLFVTCAIPTVNVAVSYAARDVVKRKIGSLTAYVELDDLDLWRHMKAHPLRSSKRAHFQRHFFNTFAAGAYELLEQHPPFPLEGSRGRTSHHVLMVGLDGPGTSLLLGIIKRWQNRQGDGEETLCVTIAGELAVRQHDEFVSRYPEAETVARCELNSWNVDPDSAALQTGGEISNSTMVFVSLASEEKALRVAQRLRARADLHAAKIVVAVDDDNGLIPHVLKDSERDLPRVHAFGVLSRGLTPKALERTVTEVIAKATHEAHRRTQFAKGRTEKDDPSLVQWDDLDESLKQSNRRFADGIADHLSGLSRPCVVLPAPLIDPRGQFERLTEDEVDYLAPLEHKRWDEDQQADGWRRMDGAKDPERKLHPNIGVPWEKLQDSDKDKDRAHVRAIPDVLALAGYQMARVAQSEGEVVRSPAKGQRNTLLGPGRRPRGAGSELERSSPTAPVSRGSSTP